MPYQIHLYICCSHYISGPQEWLMPYWASSYSSSGLRGLAEVFPRLRKILFAPSCSRWTAPMLNMGPVLELKNIPDRVLIWQINLAVIMPVTDHIWYALSCPLKKDCLSRWLVRPESLLHTSPRQIRWSQEWIHAHVEEWFQQIKYIMCHSWSSTHQSDLVELLIRKRKGLREG